MKIDIIYIACFRHDIRYTRMLVASIRRWYPAQPITLIKDYLYGDFDTTEIEKVWDVGVLKTERQRFGWGLSKLEPLFITKRERCLILDSDIVFVGAVLDRLEQYTEDFVVQLETPSPDHVRTAYFDVDALRQLDPEFEFPGFTFNTGQMVATTGLLRRADFDPFIQWSDPPVIRHPEVFKYGEQGLWNYILMKKHHESAITLRRDFFMRIPNCDDCPQINLAQLTIDSPYPLVLHWGGLKKPQIRKMSQGKVLIFFEHIYYQQLHFGFFKCLIRVSHSAIFRMASEALRLFPLFKSVLKRFKN